MALLAFAHSPRATAHDLSEGSSLRSPIITIPWPGFTLHSESAMAFDRVAAASAKWA